MALETARSSDLASLAPNTVQSDPLGLAPLPADNRQRFLRFSIAGELSGLLPLHQILEVMQIALDDIFPVPDMPSCILGVCSWKGETLWLVDLDHFVGHAPLYQPSQLAEPPMAIVIQSAGRSLGLVVERVGEVDLFDKEKIRKEPGLCSPRLEPFVLGYCPSQGGIVLDVVSIIDAPLWQSHGSALSDGSTA